MEVFVGKGRKVIVKSFYELFETVWKVMLFLTAKLSLNDKEKVNTIKKLFSKCGCEVTFFQKKHIGAKMRRPFNVLLPVKLL